MHIGLEGTHLRSQQLGGVWRYTQSLIGGLGRLTSPHRYSLLFLNVFKPWARVVPPSPPFPSMRVVEVTSVSNFLFTLVSTFIPKGLGHLRVESFLGPVDVFHSMNAVLLPQRQGRRVVTIQDLTCLKFPQHHPLIRRKLFELGVRRATKRADAVIVPSSATKRDLIAQFKLAEQKVRVVPLAPREHFVPLPEQRVAPILGQYRLAFRRYVLFVGNIEPRKNLIALIEAYNRLRKETSLTALLVLAGGEGWKNRSIYRAAALSPFAADIRFLGYVPDENLPALMNGALLFVYPSIYEGFGMPPLEAMACGTPVITSNASSLPEVVGEAALLVDPADVPAITAAMIRVLEDESLREDLRERSVKWAREFSWQETARLTVQVYESVCSSTPDALDG